MFSFWVLRVVSNSLTFKIALLSLPKIILAKFIFMFGSTCLYESTFSSFSQRRSIFRSSGLFHLDSLVARTANECGMRYLQRSTIWELLFWPLKKLDSPGLVQKCTEFWKYIEFYRIPRVYTKMYAIWNGKWIFDCTFMYIFTVNSEIPIKNSSYF